MMLPPRLVFLPTTLILFLGCGNEPNVVQLPGHRDYVGGFDGKLMARAIQTARATQQEFVDALAAQKPGTTGFSIKTGFPVSKGGEVEYLWLSETTWNGLCFEGTISSKPVDTHAVKIGDRVKVAPAELADWMYVSNRTLQGGYTLRVLHEQSSPEEKDEFSKRVPFSIPPIDF